MFDDILEFVMDYIFTPFMCVATVLVVATCIVGLFYIPSCIKQENEQQRQVEECFMQEQRTKECEYILWKYELNKKEPKHHPTVMPMPIPMIVR